MDRLDDDQDWREYEGEEAEDAADELLHEDEGEEEDDPVNGANAYFAAQHRRASRSKYAKKSLAELPGGDPQELTEAVHKLLEAIA